MQLAVCGALAALSAAPAQAYLDAAAAYGMALRYHHPPQGGKRNYRRALLLYCRADSDGHAGAAFAIGLMYAAGSGVKRSDARAAAWFHRAAAIGHVEARDLLKIFRQKGRHRAARCPNGWGRGASIRERLRAPTDIKKLIEEMAPRYRLDPKLVLAVVSVESAFQVDAISSKKAQGLMQLIPATASRFGVRDPFDPADNLRGGMAYLRWLLTRFKGRVSLALAAYNAGEGAVKRYGGVPPYKETRQYLKKIRDLYSATQHPF
jgi:hypothetical protein